jgi:hypothetical protein
MLKNIICKAGGRKAKIRIVADIVPEAIDRKLKSGLSWSKIIAIGLDNTEKKENYERNY